MYKVYLDGNALHDPSLCDQKTMIAGGTLTQVDNAAGQFVFTVYPTNPLYNGLHRLSGAIEVYDDDDMIFRGRIINDATGWINQKTVTCEGDLAMLNDTIVRPYSFSGSVESYLKQLVQQHNDQVPKDKQFTVRSVTVTDPNNLIVRSNNGYPSTMEEVQNKLVGMLGGHLILVRSNGINYLDYLVTPASGASQKIQLSKNLLDYKKTVKGEDICTAIIPLGAQIEGTEERITIKSVNGGLDYIVDESAADQYGIIYKTITWDDVTIPANLLRKAQIALSDSVTGLSSIELTAADLHQTDASIDGFRLLQTVTVEDDAHGASGTYLIRKKTTSLDNPSQNEIVIGSESKSLSSTVNQSKLDLDASKTEVKTYLTGAIDKATAMITGAEGGNVLINRTSDGKPFEILIMDTDSIDTAQNVWRFNKSGWGHSSTGYAGPYTLAALQDGSIVADAITTGTLDAARLNIGQVIDSINADGSKTISGGKVSIDGKSLSAKFSETEEKITTAVDNVQIGGRNLLLKSDVPVTTTDYIMHDYYFGAEKPVAGETYTISIKGSLHKDKLYFGVFNSGDVIGVCYPTTPDADGVYRKTFPWIDKIDNAVAGNTFIRIYAMPSRITGAESTIEWIKLEKGNKATDWTQAPEDVDSKIDAVQTRVTTAETQITQNAEAISQRATKTEVQTVKASADAANNKIDGLQVGGRNLLLDSNRLVSNNDYLVAEYTPAELLVAGQQYTVSIDIDPAAGARYNVFLSGGYAHQCTLEPPAADRTVVSKTFTARYDSSHLPETNPAYGRLQIYRAPNDGTVTEKTTIYKIKLEKGNKSTDWSPAPEDQDDALNQAITKVETQQSEILQKSNEIMLQALSSYITKTRLEEFEKEVSARLAVQSDNITASFNQANTYTVEVDGRLQEFLEEFATYIRMSASGIELGDSNSPFGALLGTTKLSFTQDGREIAYISNNRLYITDAEISNSLTVGSSIKYKTYIDSNGYLVTQKG